MEVSLIRGVRPKKSWSDISIAIPNELLVQVCSKVSFWSITIGNFKHVLSNEAKSRRKRI